MPWPKGRKPSPESAKKQIATHIARIKAKHHDDQVFSVGILHWQSIDYRQFGYKTQVCIEVTCGRCGLRRWERLSRISHLIRRNKFTGRCTKCSYTPGRSNAIAKANRRTVRERLTKEHPTSEKLSNGILHWPTLRYTILHKRHRLAVDVECGTCGTIKTKSYDGLSKKYRAGRLTGCCQQCSVKAIRGSRHHWWKGGKWVTARGYVALTLSSDHPMFCMMQQSRGYVYEHRLIVAEHIGRPLLPTEHVHHKNGKKDDNRIENLELVNSSEHCVITHLERRVKQLEKFIIAHHLTPPPAS